jgi:hypothetical protein
MASSFLAWRSTEPARAESRLIWSILAGAGMRAPAVFMATSQTGAACGGAEKAAWVERSAWAGATVTAFHLSRMCEGKALTVRGSCLSVQYQPTTR